MEEAKIDGGSAASSRKTAALILGLVQKEYEHYQLTSSGFFVSELVSPRLFF